MQYLLWLWHMEGMVMWHWNHFLLSKIVVSGTRNIEVACYGVYMWQSVRLCPLPDFFFILVPLSLVAGAWWVVAKRLRS